MTGINIEVTQENFEEGTQMGKETLEGCNEADDSKLNALLNG